MTSFFNIVNQILERTKAGVFIYLFVFTLTESSPKDGAKISIQWIYQNPSSQLENGMTCDRLGHPGCDVYFNVFLANGEYGTQFVDNYPILKHTTSVYENMNHLRFTDRNGVETFAAIPLPDKYYLRMEIYDSDIFNTKEVIGTFKNESFSVQPGTVWTNIKLQRSNPNFRNEHVSISIKMKSTCPMHHYGKKCYDFCQPQPNKYTCDQNGKYICEAGLRGEHCDKEDSCHFEKCAPHATCYNRDDVTGRRCICNGSDTSSCYPNYNPCAHKPCLNDGLCTAIGAYNESFKCECSERWTGHRCSERKSACAVETLRLRKQYPNVSSDNQVLQICSNGGVCYEHPIDFRVKCVCGPLWFGERCERQITNSSHWIILFTIGTVVVIIIVISICLIFFYISFKRQQKRMEKFHSTYGGVVFDQKLGDQKQNKSNSHIKSPVTHFVNNAYGNMTGMNPVFGKEIPTYAARNQLSADEYDECNPLGLYNRTNIYATSFADDTILNPYNHTDTKSMIQQAPALPERPDKLNFNSTFQQNRVTTRHSSSIYSNAEEVLNCNENANYSSIDQIKLSKEQLHQQHLKSNGMEVRHEY